MMLCCRNQKRRSIIAHIQFRVIIIIAFGMITCILSTIIPAYRSLNEWKSNLELTLNGATQQQQNTILIQITRNLDTLYEKASIDLQTGTNYIIDALNHSLPIKNYYRNYFGDSTVDSIIPANDFQGKSMNSMNFIRGTV